MVSVPMIMAVVLWGVGSAAPEGVPRTMDELVAQQEFRAQLLLARAVIHEALGEQQAAAEDRELAWEHLDVVWAHQGRGRQALAAARRALARQRRGEQPEPWGGSDEDDWALPTAGRHALRSAREQLRSSRRDPDLEDW